MFRIAKEYQAGSIQSAQAQPDQLVARDKGTQLRVIGVTMRNYRVMAQRKDGTVSLLSLEETLRAARLAAERAFKYHQRRLDRDPKRELAKSDRPIRIFVQTWSGTPTDGCWAGTNERQGRFDWKLKRPKGKAATKLTGKYVSGDCVRCEILPEKTRRGGWRARIVGTAHSGPVICHGEPGTDWRPGTKVELRLSSLSERTGTVQFAWF